MSPLCSSTPLAAGCVTHQPARIRSNHRCLSTGWPLCAAAADAGALSPAHAPEPHFPSRAPNRRRALSGRTSIALSRTAATGGAGRRARGVPEGSRRPRLRATCRAGQTAGGLAAATKSPPRSPARPAGWPPCPRAAAAGAQPPPPPHLLARLAQNHGTMAANHSKHSQPRSSL